MPAFELTLDELREGLRGADWDDHAEHAEELRGHINAALAKRAPRAASDAQSAEQARKVDAMWRAFERMTKMASPWFDIGRETMQEVWNG